MADHFMETTKTIVNAISRAESDCFGKNLKCYAQKINGDEGWYYCLAVSMNNF